VRTGKFTDGEGIDLIEVLILPRVEELAIGLRMG
jgi:hypothetical protein